MLTHDEMVGFQAEKGELVEAFKFNDNKSYVLHLIHTKAYEKAAEIACGKKVLDLGCNTGYGTHIISQMCNKTWGVDVSEKAVNIARQNYVSENIDFRVIDGKKLPFADNNFDLVVSFQVLEHIVAHEDYLLEVKRVLVPDGKVIFTTPNRAIRLYPGMEPWNEFHVTEYGFRELDKLLSFFFDRVEITGLFADEPLYSIELKRVGRIRDRAKIKQGSNLNPLFKSVLLLLMNLRTSLQKRLNPEEDIRNKYSTKSLYFKHDDLDNALDLMAMCINNK